MTMRVKNDEEKTHEQAIELQGTIKVSRFENNIKMIASFLYDSKKILGVPILVTGGVNSLSNMYVMAFKKEMNKVFVFVNKPSGIDKEKWWSCLDSEDSSDKVKLQRIIEELMQEKVFFFGHVYHNSSECWKSEFIKYYIIFWNLFLAAMDDDIYNEQLATVAELAACFGFDEPMMRDWCRAVEYIFAGNKLSEDCDLECETVEGARFFLHKEE